MPNIHLDEVIISYVCLLFALCFHEAAHAFVADRCGDPSARLMGRISMNPLVHIDPMGTVVMPLLLMLTGVPYLFGWAKPVPFNPRNLHDIRKDPVYIAVAGPISNLLLALAAAVVLKIALLVAPQLFLSSGGLILLRMALTFVAINIILMVFNLIPIPPLDGHYVLSYFLPPAAQQMLRQIGPFGLIIVLVIAGRSGIISGPTNYLLTLINQFIGIQVV